MRLTGSALSAVLAEERERHRAAVAVLPPHGGEGAEGRHAVARALGPGRAEVTRLIAGEATPDGATHLLLPGLTPAANLHALLLAELVRWQGPAVPATLVGLADVLDCELPAELAARVVPEDVEPALVPAVAAAAREAYARITAIAEALLERTAAFFTDPARFPPDWITAVREAIARARAT